MRNDDLVEALLRLAPTLPEHTDLIQLAAKRLLQHQIKLQLVKSELLRRQPD